MVFLNAASTIDGIMGNVHTGPADDLAVSRDLTVGDDVTITDQLSVGGNATVGGTLSVTGQSTLGDVVSGNLSSVGDTFLCYNGTSGDSALAINNTTRDITVKGAINSDSNLVCSGTINAGRRCTFYPGSSIIASQSTFNTIMQVNTSNFYFPSNVSGATIGGITSGFYAVKIHFSFIDAEHGGSIGGLNFGITAGEYAGYLYIRSGATSDSDSIPVYPIKALSGSAIAATDFTLEFQWKMANNGGVKQMELQFKVVTSASFSNTQGAFIPKIELVKTLESDLFD